MKIQNLWIKKNWQGENHKEKRRDWLPFALWIDLRLIKHHLDFSFFKVIADLQERSFQLYLLGFGFRPDYFPVGLKYVFRNPICFIKEKKKIDGFEFIISLAMAWHIISIYWERKRGILIQLFGLEIEI